MINHRKYNLNYCFIKKIQLLISSKNHLFYLLNQIALFKYQLQWSINLAF